MKVFCTRCDEQSQIRFQTVEDQNFYTEEKIVCWICGTEIKTIFLLKALAKEISELKENLKIEE